MRYVGLDVYKDNIAACVPTKVEKPKFEKDFKKIGDFWELMNSWSSVTKMDSS